MNPEPRPIAADEPYDVYSMFDVIPRIVTSIAPARFGYVTLLSAFIGVGSAFIGVSKDLPLQ